MPAKGRLGLLHGQGGRCARAELNKLLWGCSKPTLCYSALHLENVLKQENLDCSRGNTEKGLNARMIFTPISSLPVARSTCPIVSADNYSQSKFSRGAERTKTKRVYGGNIVDPNYCPETILEVHRQEQCEQIGSNHLLILGTEFMYL